MLLMTETKKNLADRSLEILGWDPLVGCISTRRGHVFKGHTDMLKSFQRRKRSVARPSKIWDEDRKKPE